MKRRRINLPIEFRTGHQHVVPFLIQEAKDYLVEVERVLNRLRTQYDKYSARHGHLKDF